MHLLFSESLFWDCSLAVCSNIAGGQLLCDFLNQVAVPFFLLAVLDLFLELSETDFAAISRFLRKADRTWRKIVQGYRSSQNIEENNKSESTFIAYLWATNTVEQEYEQSLWGVQQNKQKLEHQQLLIHSK